MSILYVYVKTELVNRKTKAERHKLISARDMSAKMAANGIGTHARTNQSHTLAYRSRKSLNHHSSVLVTKHINI